MCGSEPCAHERGDAITSFVTQTRALVAVTAERDEALAALARVRTLVVDPHAAMVVDRIRTALKPTDQPKGKP